MQNFRTLMVEGDDVTISHMEPEVYNINLTLNSTTESVIKVISHPTCLYSGEHIF